MNPGPRASTYVKLITAPTASDGTVSVPSVAPATVRSNPTLPGTGPLVPPKPVRVSRMRTGSIGTKTAPDGRAVALAG